MRLIVIEIPDDCPTCDKCGVPVETAYGAATGKMDEQDEQDMRDAGRLP